MVLSVKALEMGLINWKSVEECLRHGLAGPHSLVEIVVPLLVPELLFFLVLP